MKNILDYFEIVSKDDYVKDQVNKQIVLNLLIEIYYRYITKPFTLVECSPLFILCDDIRKIRKKIHGNNPSLNKIRINSREIKVDPIYLKYCNKIQLDNTDISAIESALLTKYHNQEVACFICGTYVHEMRFTSLKSLLIYLKCYHGCNRAVFRIN